LVGNFIVIGWPAKRGFLVAAHLLGGRSSRQVLRCFGLPIAKQLLGELPAVKSGSQLKFA